MYLICNGFEEFKYGKVVKAIKSRQNLFKLITSDRFNGKLVNGKYFLELIYKKPISFKKALKSVEDGKLIFLPGVGEIYKDKNKYYLKTLNIKTIKDVNVKHSGVNIDLLDGANESDIAKDECQIKEFNNIEDIDLSVKAYFSKWYVGYIPLDEYL